jgi:DNA-binding helix-hairpin-helix protein with protein kinase domain
MKLKYYTHSGKPIILGSRIAKGGEGEVYNLENSDRCIKIYHPNLRNRDREEKLKHMCSNLPTGNSHKMFRICWPEELVYSGSGFVGFLMQKAYDDSIMAYHLCQVSIPNKLSSSWQQTYDRQSYNGTINRLKLTTNIAASIHHIHKSGNYVLADLKPQNILLTLDGKVSLIDLDSIQVSGNHDEIFKAPVSTPEYTPPEAKYLIKNNHLISTNWDIFSLGVIIYEVLCGIHPYAGTANPPHDNLTTICDKIENNLTHINVGKGSFSALPQPHMNFYQFSSGLQSIFKQTFSERSL